MKKIFRNRIQFSSSRLPGRLRSLLNDFLSTALLVLGKEFRVGGTWIWRVWGVVEQWNRFFDYFIKIPAPFELVACARANSVVVVIIGQGQMDAALPL
jgi:hypothetical protein